MSRYKYKIGDVIKMIRGVNDIYMDRSGIIVDSEVATRYPSVVDINYKINFPNVMGKPSHWLFPHSFELDKQFYREKRLKKILDK